MKYRYPAGTIIEESGELLAEAAVLAPCRVVIDGILHGPEICELWTPEALAALGIRRVVQDALPVDATGWPFLPGEPVDVEEALLIRRTYPNAVPDVEGSAANLAQLAVRVRSERDARLAACDWTQMPDAPLTTEAKAAWAAYRQALRDVPGQAGFPLAVEWPMVVGA
jgi:hypothetical protein